MADLKIEGAQLAEDNARLREENLKLKEQPFAQRGALLREEPLVEEKSRRNGCCRALLSPLLWRAAPGEFHTREGKRAPGREGAMPGSPQERMGRLGNVPLAAHDAATTASPVLCCSPTVPQRFSESACRRGLSESIGPLWQPFAIGRCDKIARWIDPCRASATSAAKWISRLVVQLTSPGVRKSGRSLASNPPCCQGSQRDHDADQKTNGGASKRRENETANEEYPHRAGHICLVGPDD